MTKAIFFISFLFLYGCVSSPNIVVHEYSKLSDLKDLNGCNFSFQCKKLYTGYNPCGGHTGYITYSTLIGSQNVKNLKKAVLNDRLDQQEKYQKMKLIECQPSVTLWPDPVCQYSQCVMK